MASLLKKADLAKDTPMPSVLQQEKEKDRRIEQARLAEAAKGAAKAKAVHGASAKPKPRPRSKSPNVPGASGNRAELQSRILEQAKVYTATQKDRPDIFQLRRSKKGRDVIQAGCRSETAYEARLLRLR